MRAKLIAVGILIFILAGCLVYMNWRHGIENTAPGNIDIYDIAGYRWRLEFSSTPDAVAIKKRMASADSDLSRELAAAKSEGLPSQFAMFIPKPVPPPQNAAAEYEFLARVNGSGYSRLSRITHLDTGVTYAPSILAKAQKYLSDNANVLTILRQASVKPYYIPNRNWQYGAFSAITPDLSREMVLLKTEIQLLTREGQIDRALSECLIGFRIARQMASDPTLSGYQNGILYHRLMMSCLRDILYLNGREARVAVKVENIAKEQYWNSSFRRHLLAAYASCNDSIKPMFDCVKPADLEHFATRSAAGTRNTLNPYTADETKFLKILLITVEVENLTDLHSLVNAYGKPVSERLGEIHRRRLHPSQFVWESVQSTYRQYLTLYEDAIIDAVKLQAEDGVVTGGASILAYRERHGAFPKNTNQVEDICDPFTGKSLLYREEQNGFVVYSVGGTGSFDGGTHGLKSTGEVYFRWPVSK